MSNSLLEPARLLLQKAGIEPSDLKRRLLYLALRARGVVRHDTQNNTYVRDVEGHKMHLHPLDCGISMALARDGIREKESVGALCQHVRPDMTILDLGANIGFYVLLEARMVSKGSGRIIALEPSPANIRLLNLNIETNNYGDRVRVFQGAVTDHSGTTRFDIAPFSNSNILSDLSSLDKVEKTIDVPAYTFPAFLEAAGVSIEQVDFLRMDIESAEYLIFQDILDQIKKKRSFLMFVEFHPLASHLRTHKEILRTLESIGYRCLSATKEYSEDGTGKIGRRHHPNATIRDLYSDDFFLQPGGCEVFLQKP